MAFEVDGVQAQVAALAPAPAQRRRADPAVLDPEPLVQVDQVSGLVGEDRRPPVGGLAGLLADLGQRRSRLAMATAASAVTCSRSAPAACSAPGCSPAAP